MTTTKTLGRLSTLPDEPTLTATVTALEEHRNFALDFATQAQEMNLVRQVVGF